MMADKTCNDCRQRKTCIMAAPDGKWTACDRFEEKEMDLIDREQAIKATENLQDCYNGFSDTYDKACIIGVLEELPSAEKTGKWLAYEFGDERWHKCSVCGTADEYINNLGLVAIRKYCPNCGALMREAK